MLAPFQSNTDILLGTPKQLTVHCIDFYPTLTEVTGVDVALLKKPNGEKLKLDGVSFAKILTGEQKRLEKNNLFWHFLGYMDFRMRPTTVIQKRIEDEYYKLFYYYETDKYALFHLNTDISEKHNLLKKPFAKETEIAVQMNTDLITWIKEGTKVP